MNLLLQGLRAAGEAIDALLAMDGVPEELKLQTKDLADSVSKELALHEAFKKKD